MWLCVHMCISSVASPSSHFHYWLWSHYSHFSFKYELKPVDPDLQPVPKKLQLMLEPLTKRVTKDGMGHLVINDLAYISFRKYTI